MGSCHVAYQRDPLSVEYDAWSAGVLAEAIADQFVWHSHRVNSPARDPVDDKGLSMHERAAQRSLYYMLNYSPSTGVKVPQRMWSLQLDWGRPRVEGSAFRRTRRRFVLARVTPYRTARQIIKGRRNLYTERPGLRSRGELPGDDWEPRAGYQDDG
jgi:hypothetical protein